MENKKLSEYFKKVISQVENQGYAPIVVRESFDRVAPNLPWQHNWLILFILIVALLMGAFLPPVVILASFLLGSLSSVAAAILFFGNGFFLYFAMSAFNIHEWVKFLFISLISLILAVGAYAAHFGATLATKGVEVWMAGMSEKLGALTGMASAMGSEVGGAVGILDMTIPQPINVFALIGLLLLGYNLWPLIFWIVEKVQAGKSGVESEKPKSE